MKKWFIVIFFLVKLTSVEAQSTLGYQVFHRFMDYPNWNNKPIDMIPPQELAKFSDHAGLGVEYTKQLKKTSLNAIVASFAADYSLPFNRSGDFANVHLLAGYRFYPFNQEDCDCPSFYQTGSIFSRGFNLTPRAGLNILWLIDDHFQYLFAGGVDMALDIPLNKTTTISPFAGINVTSYARNPALVQEYQKSNINSINLGVKLIKNLPKKKNY